MADIFKNAIQAGYEARSLGQRGIKPPEDPSLQRLGESFKEGYDSFTPTPSAPVQKVASEPPEDLIAKITQDYRASYESDPAWQKSQEPAPKEVGFTDSVEKGFKGLMVTWDFLANKLEKAVTGQETDTAPILAKSVDEYKRLASDPRIGEMVRRGDQAEGWFQAGKEMLSYAIDNPGLIVNFLGEQIPAVVASLPIGGVAGGVTNQAVARTAIGAATQKAVVMGSTGAAINSSAVVLGSLGTNYVEGLDKFQGDVERAKDYATTKTLNEVPANAVAGAFLGVNPFTRFAAKSPTAAAVGNVGFQTAAQGAGGGVGAYQAAQSVGEQAGKGQILTEIFGEGLFAPVDIATARRETRGIQTPTQTTAPVDPQAEAQFANAPNIDITGVGVNPNAAPAQAPAQSFNITDDEYRSAVNSPPFMSALYSRSDENGRAALQSANPNLNLPGLAEDANLVMDGLKIADANPQFVSSFVQRLVAEKPQPQPTAQASAPAPFDGGDTVQKTGEFIPARPSMELARSLAQEGQMLSSGELVSPTQAAAIKDQKAQVNPEVDQPLPPTQSNLSQLSQAEQLIQNQPRFGLPSTISAANSNYVVEVGPTNKKRKDSSPVNAFVSHTGKVIKIDGQAIVDTFDEKPWTKPKVEGVKALPEDTFQNSGEWLNFVFNHETAHIDNKKQKGESTGEYENRINQIALEKIKGKEYADSVYNVVPDGAWEGAPSESASQIEAYRKSQQEDKALVEKLNKSIEEDKKAAAAKPAVKRVKFAEVSNETTTNQVQKAAPESKAEPKGTVEPSRQEPTAINPQERAAPDEQVSQVPVQGVTQGTFETPKKPTSADVLANESMTKEAAQRRAEAVKKLDNEPYSDAIAITRIETKFGKSEWDINAKPIREFYKDGELVGKLFKGKGRDGYLAYDIKGLDQSKNFSIKAGSPEGLIVDMIKQKATMRMPLEGQASIPLVRQPDIEAQKAAAGIKEEAFVPESQKTEVQKEFERQEKRDAEKQKQLDQATRTASRNRAPGMFDDDTGGVMGNLARSGAMGTDASAELGVKERRGAARAIQEQKDVEANAARLDQRVRNVTENITDPELRRLAEEQLADDTSFVTGEKTDTQTNEDFTPEAIQESLALETEQQSAAIQLADAVSKGELTLSDAKKRARAEGVGNYNLVNAMRQFNIDPTVEDINDSGNLALNHTLRSFVRDSGYKGYHAREMWLKSYDNLKNKDQVELTASEKAAYDNWKANREKYQQRLSNEVKENAPYMAGTLENVFPNVLFTQFTLNEMRDPSLIPQPMQTMVRDLFADPAKAWFEDVAEVLTIRPDFEEQVYANLTKDEQAAYEDFRTRQLREAFSRADMLVKSPAYSQLDQLRYLSPDLFLEFRSKIAVAEQNQLSQILHEAAEMNDRAKAAIDAGANPENTIDAQMREYMLRDEQLSVNPDEMTDEDGTALFKRGYYSGAVSALTIQEHLTNKFAKWENQPAYTVVQNANQLPIDVKARLTKRIQSGGFKGALDPKTGHIYLFSDFMENVADAEFTMFHELFGHWGVRAFLGDQVNPFLENQYKLNQKLRESADTIARESQENGMPMARLESIEEAISDMAAQGDTSAFRQLIGKLVAWLKANGFEGVAKWMDKSGESELAYVLSQARRAARGQGINPMDGAPSDVRYAANKMPVEVFATRDRQTTGYARINPITGHWTVFTIENISTGDFSAQTVEDFGQALAILKKVGDVVKAKDRATRVDINPGDFVNIPDTREVVGWRRIARLARQKVQSQYQPVFEVAEYLNRNGKENDVSEALKLYEGRTKFYVDDFEVRYQVPMQRLLKKVGDMGGSVDDVDLYLLARHAKERNAAIKQITDNEIGSGMAPKTRTDAKGNVIPGYIDVLNEAVDKPYFKELEALGKLTDSLSRDKVNYMLAHGQISGSQAESLSQYDHYVNLSGNDELKLDEYDSSVLAGRSMNLRGSDAQRALGRGTLPVDILQNTMNAYLSTVIRGQKNIVARAVLDMVEANPDPTFAVVEEISEKKRFNADKWIKDQNILKVLGDAPTVGSGRQFLENIALKTANGEMTGDEAVTAIRERIREAEARRDITPEEADAAIAKVDEETALAGKLSADGYVSMVEDPTVVNAPNVFVAKVDGKPVKIIFEKKGTEFINSLSGMSMQSSSSTLAAVGAWGRFFSQLVTSWNPAWVAVNGIRDFQTVLSNMATDPRVGAGLAKEMSKEWSNAFRTAFRYQVADQAAKTDGWWGSYLSSRSEKHPLSEVDIDLYNEFRQSGAETFFLDRKNLEETIDTMNRHINGPSGLLDWTKGTMEGVGSVMELMTLPMETAPRFAVYKVLRQNGWSVQDAAVYAKEVSVNFNMKGSSAWIRNLFVFANPSIQGTFRMFQDYSRGETGAQRFMPSNKFSAVMGGWMMLGILSNFLARGLGGEDDELKGVDKLDQIPHHKRSTSLILAPDVPGGALPIGYGINFFFTIGHYLPDIWTGKLEAGQVAGRILKTGFDAFSPIGSGADSKTLAGSVLKTVTPSIAVPLVEIGMNENRFGAPIYREQSPFSDVKEANAYMHFDSANPLSTSTFHALNQATKGTRYKSGLIDVNPAVVDYMISSYLPGLLNDTYKAAGLAVRKGRGEDTKDAPLPLVDRLTAKVSDGWDAGAIRRAKEVVDTTYKELTAPDTTKERRQEIRSQYPGIGAAKAVMAGTDQQIKQINQSIEAYERDPRKSDEAKVAFRNKMESNKRKIQNRAVQAVLNAGFRNELINE